MSKIRVLSDLVANQIAAGEVVERPASVAKELVENAIDAGARRIVIESEAGGRKTLRVGDDGEGMTRDDAILAFERHATSKINSAHDLNRIATLGFRGEALASIAAVARVELISCTEGEPSATRVVIEGGRMRDVSPAAHPRGTSITVRDLFFNVPARRKFLRSEATETFHLTNLVTHYALANPAIAFTLTSNGREILRAASATDTRERAYQIFGREFLENLLTLAENRQPNETATAAARVGGFVSSPRERRTSRDAQYLFVNGRFVRDRLIGRALWEGYRGLLPAGSHPVALLFLQVPLEEVDVNVHPAKTEVRFRRAAAVSDAIREVVRRALASAGYTRGIADQDDEGSTTKPRDQNSGWQEVHDAAATARAALQASDSNSGRQDTLTLLRANVSDDATAFGPRESATAATPLQINDTSLPQSDEADDITDGTAPHTFSRDADDDRAFMRRENAGDDTAANDPQAVSTDPSSSSAFVPEMRDAATRAGENGKTLPSLVSAFGLVREVGLAALSHDIRPLGQLEESYIIATDERGLLLIDQHGAHERVLFEKYRADEAERARESQHLLMPEMLELSPAQSVVYDAVAGELESYGFALMRLSGRTVAVKAVPVDLPPSAARSLLAEVLETVDVRKRDALRAGLRDRIASSLACHAAIKSNTLLTTEKMRWLIDQLLMTTAAAISPHGRPLILRLNTRDIQKGFQRS